MDLRIKQISSLEKIRSVADIPEHGISGKTMLGGEIFCYQLALDARNVAELTISVDSPIAEYVHLYRVDNTLMDLPCLPAKDTDFITADPGVMPDLLTPLALCGNQLRLYATLGALWVEVKLPNGMPAGEYPINIVIDACNTDVPGDAERLTAHMDITLLPADLPEQTLIFTQWFHVDCIASAHNVEIYSEAHWELIDKYMALASELGINMLLTPVITPPLDTGIGLTRPCTQLVEITKSDDDYSFDFSRLTRWIELCCKNRIKRFEISHLFSQWGIKYTPNIWVNEQGERKHLFGWHVEARDPSYRKFLGQFLPALVKHLKSEGVFENCTFHISDEPSPEHLENYRYARDLVVPLIDGAKVMDALSNVDFYDLGLVQIPVTANDHIDPFLERDIPERWTYYCCVQCVDVSNRFMSHPSYRNRIIGIQMYKHGISGFLHWGYNFYYSRHSHHEINPYLISSADRAFPSGDPFSVYPHKSGPLPSLRAMVFRDAIQDMRLCALLESFIGKDAVVELIDREAGMDVTFSKYPKNSAYLPSLNDKIKDLLKEYLV